MFDELVKGTEDDTWTWGAYFWEGDPEPIPKTIYVKILKPIKLKKSRVIVSSSVGLL